MRKQVTISNEVHQALLKLQQQTTLPLRNVLETCIMAGIGAKSPQLVADFGKPVAAKSVVHSDDDIM